MERELWAELMAGLHDVWRGGRRRESGRITHATALVVKVYLWAVLHDRPVVWATCWRNWPRHVRPPRLPSQSTMSRRLRSNSVAAFMAALASRMRGRDDKDALKLIDACALPVSENTRDPDAPKPGRAPGGFARGYKLFCLWGQRSMPEAFEIQPIHVSEISVGRRLLSQLRGRGLVLGDSLYDCNDLYELAASRSHRLLAPRKKPKARLERRNLSRLRVWSSRVMRKRRLRRRLRRARTNIERRFAALRGFGGGLMSLPPWVRRLHRVRLWVTAKLLINAARIRNAVRPLDA